MKTKSFHPNTIREQRIVISDRLTAVFYGYEKALYDPDFTDADARKRSFAFKRGYRSGKRASNKIQFKTLEKCQRDTLSS